MNLQIFPPVEPVSGKRGPAMDTPILVEAEPGQRLSEAIWLSGEVMPVPLCGGIAHCGRCRVRFLDAPPAVVAADRSVLTEEELSMGWRLACSHTVPDAEAVRIALPESRRRKRSGRQETTFTVKGGGHLVLAVDLGTTSLVWRAVSPGGQEVAAGSELNPQSGAGADVMSRLAASRTRSGQERLARLVAERLVQIVGELPGATEAIVLAGNTAMTDIFLGEGLEGLACAPYRLSHTGNAVFHLYDLPPVYIPPLAAPFLGGDVTAGLAALERRDVALPAVLADLGTNGEFVLLCQDGTLYLTSVPLGPALEGIGPECGRMAGSDAITSFSLGPAGLSGKTADGLSVPGAAVRGISATGYLSLLSILLKTGALTPEGQFADGRTGTMLPLARHLLSRVKERRGQRCLSLPCDVWLSLSDIEELLKVKAAFRVALDILMEAASLSPSALSSLCLAGALGQYVAPDDLETLGFIPRGMARRVLPVGNTSLEGASLLGLHPEIRGSLAKQVAGAVLLEPARDSSFQQRYLNAMHWGH